MESLNYPCPIRANQGTISVFRNKIEYETHKITTVALVSVMNRANQADSVDQMDKQTYLASPRLVLYLLSIIKKEQG